MNAGERERSRRASLARHAAAAFDVFYERRQATWLRYAHAHIGHAEGAEQVVDEVTARLLRTWEHVLRQESVEGYAWALLKAAVARRTAERGARSAFVESAVFDRVTHAMHTTGACLDVMKVLEGALGFYSAICRLPERQYDAVLLRYVLGCSESDTAQLLSVAAPTVRSHIRYARRRLLLQLGEGIERESARAAASLPALSAAAAAAAEPTPAARIDQMLEHAQILVRDYVDYDPPSAAERVARADAAAEGPADTPIGSDTTTAPPHFPSEHEQARYELDVAAALVLNTPQAADCLARLADERHVDPEGALVFACLLYLTGRDDAAQFWWRFAAGGGSHTAAFCLHLQHRRRAEFRDARYWRGQAARLRDSSRAQAPAGRMPVGRPLLPQQVRRDLLAQCHDGNQPRLPLAIEAVVNRLSVDRDDPDFGEIPQPSARLTGQLAAPAGT